MQLARLQERCNSLAPLLYREQAQYLELVRRILPIAVKAAIRHLLCSLSPLQRASLSERQTLLQQRIDALVQRASSMITIEQLLVLAARLQDEERRSRIQQFQNLADRSSSSVEPAVTEAPSPGIELGLDLPLERPDLLEGLLPNDPRSTADDLVDRSDVKETQSLTSADSGSEMSELEILRSLFVMAGESLEQGESSQELQGGPEPDESHLDPLAQSSDQLMPSTASGLLSWMDSVDSALIRRLRNVSHAVNVELMRAGVTRSLLPIQLLDAVNSGQLPSQSAPSNVLRLTLPLSMVVDDQAIDTACILMRPSELEFDDHALRRSRSRLRLQRRDLGTLLLKERHWQRRASVREVQNHWWPNQPETPQLS
ncbi:hypothetical protein MITS9509_01107 [Synechococcus sp. MIT S9509]|uniref:hypothetical protein n=1 Tax=unclassified Synechococcus TaxID=2626047 RepID=UPI0007BC7BAE|nr:hypothetical protein [Synechococcus sp. MIT S9509]KZR87257.1 hypothetical protein MITS9504_00673 [Synechococcus sp. MIT S9504]KZR92658.1 hypothetical protein MITS9509_01107 [Synechococcus sp. MIT S9509]